MTIRAELIIDESTSCVPAIIEVTGTREDMGGLVKVQVSGRPPRDEIFFYGFKQGFGGAICRAATRSNVQVAAGETKLFRTTAISYDVKNGKLVPEQIVYKVSGS